VRCRTKEEGVHYEFVVKTPQHSVTSVDPAENEWWRVFSETTQKLGLGIETEIFPAGVPPRYFFHVLCVRACELLIAFGTSTATDSRYLRQVGIPAFGFSPINRTPILLHDHNEFLSAKVPRCTSLVTASKMVNLSL
jgi:aminoacylase